MYCCFLDLKGAYDRVNRDLLWEVLRRLGIDGRMLGAVQALYADNSMSINVEGRTGQPYPSYTGVMSGCPLSPTLFGLFIDGLHRHLLWHCPDEGPQLRCGRRVPDLAYANDFVLMVGTSAGLQRLLHTAVEFCQLVGMVISVQKSKVMVFTDRFPGPYEWLCGGSPLQWVAQFEYLGVTLSAESGMGPTFGKLHETCGRHGPSCGDSLVSCIAVCICLVAFPRL